MNTKVWFQVEKIFLWRYTRACARDSVLSSQLCQTCEKCCECCTRRRALLLDKSCIKSLSSLFMQLDLTQVYSKGKLDIAAWMENWEFVFCEAQREALNQLTVCFAKSIYMSARSMRLDWINLGQQYIIWF